MIIYSKNSDHCNAAIDYYETPIKMIIEHTSNLMEKSGGIAKQLFNFEKSNNFGETIVGSAGFDTFSAVVEGGEAERDTFYENHNKFIEHIQFMKEFVISAEMMEDAKYGIATSAKHRAESFARAYHKTINKICEMALCNSTSYSMQYGTREINISAPDNLPLFSGNHYYGISEIDTFGRQSNFFWGDIFKSGAEGSRVASVEVFEEALANLSIKLRNMLNDRGEALGYTADTIILPGNRPLAEIMVKKVCGNLGAINSGYNNISAHFGAWNVVVLPNWRTDDDRIMIMSSEANKNLCGNMFFNRVPLTVSNWIDHHTGNYIWNGRCRFGIGFASYRHILLAVDSATEIENATEM